MNLAWDSAIAAGRVRAVVHDGLWFHLSTPSDLADAEYDLHARAIGRDTMNLAAIPRHVPFLDTVAARWLPRARRPAAVAHGLILLPTRRAARALADAFLRASGGQPLLLPRITALGALDEAPLTLAGALDLPPAVEPAHRLAVLSRLILALPEASGGRAPPTAPGCWRANWRC